MRESSRIILENFQIRKNHKQKERFISWLKNYTANLGYTLKIDNYRKNANNLIVGDVKNAKIILTAHYDTPAVSLFPILTWIGNKTLFALSQFFSALIYFIVALIIGRISYFFIPNVFFSFMVIASVMFLFSFITISGPANVNNANDNTSGVATLLSIMEDLALDKRDSICFVFFDEEEKSLVGSTFFKKKYVNFVNDLPLINFDCVANGDNFLFIIKKAFENTKEHDSLKNIISIKNEIYKNKHFQIGSSNTHVYMSDQLLFDNGVGVVALKKTDYLGLYLNDIHTKKDTVFQSENIEILKNIMIHLINTL